MLRMRLDHLSYAAGPDGLVGSAHRIGELLGEDVDVDVLRAWVRKEALLKSTGEGLTTAMSTIRLSRRPDGTRTDGRRGTVHDLESVADVVLAVAGDGLSRPVFTDASPDVLSVRP